METSIDWKHLSTLAGRTKVNPKKHLILQRALDIISENGLQGLSVTNLAKRTGLSKSLVIYHYEKPELIIEDLFFYIGKLGRMYTNLSFEGKESFEQKIAAMIEATFNWVAFNPQVGEFFVLMFHEASKTEPMEQIRKNIFDNAQEMWERIFFESMKYNSLDEVKTLTSGVHHLLQGTLVTMISKRDYKNYLFYANNIKANIEILLRVNLPQLQFEIN